MPRWRQPGLAFEAVRVARTKRMNVMLNATGRMWQYMLGLRQPTHTWDRQTVRRLSLTSRRWASGLLLRHIIKRFANTNSYAVPRTGLLGPEARQALFSLSYILYSSVTDGIMQATIIGSCNREGEVALYARWPMTIKNEGKVFWSLELLSEIGGVRGND